MLTAAVAHEAYIVWWAKVSAFDAAHPDSPIRDREARRLVDVSQPGAAAWLRITPDRTVPHSRPDSATTTTGVERHLGLYLTSGQPGFDAMEAAGHEVTDSDRLGDTAINAKSTNKSPRHNKLNRAVASVRLHICCYKTVTKRLRNRKFSRLRRAPPSKETINGSKSAAGEKKKWHFEGVYRRKCF